MNWRSISRERRGHSLIECLVVVAIIGLLAAILIPAVQAAREAARRAQCANNLRQFALALNSYASALGSLPGCHNGNDFSVHVAILPYVERKPLYDSLNLSFAAGVSPAENSTASSAMPGLFLCPSEAVEPAGGLQGATSYGGNLGSGVQMYGYNGAFGHPYSAVRLSEFSDGLSSTAWIAEWCIGGPGPPARVRNRALFHAPSLPGPNELDAFASACRNVDIQSARTNPHYKGSNWTWGEFSHTFYNHVLPPNQPSCLNGNGFQIGAFTAGSLHPGGAHVAYGDGHIGFVVDGVNPAIWRAEGSRNGQEASSTVD